ncbi:FtsX-like permease family protein [Pseudoduganella eburnea]|uniref:FtsX-like permease family protein n=1 Tax=Massilia eburnea TaxID=1776165 RepID=A0A6L6QC81_9BURK|nr:FtsX-like permease family protein [Massilia eburnea]MTW09386.1 FtsX-like permease family protein [Massilia eburnea]
MLRHLLKLTWKRKTRNMLLSVEIMLAFVIVFAIAATGVRYWQLYHRPLGFQYQDVWAVQLQPPMDNRFARTEGAHDLFLRALQAMPQVEDAALTNFALFQDSSMVSRFKAPDGGRETRSNMVETNDRFWYTLGMKLAAGRWPSAQDNGADAAPAVVNRRMAEELFPDRSPLGQLIVAESSDPKNAARFRIVGTIDDFRSHGEFMAPRPVVLFRQSSVDGNKTQMTLLVKMHPGTPRSFELDLQRQLKQVRNDWSYTINPLAELRTSQLAEKLVPLKILALVAVFLLAMVGFGLFGVLWQNTTRRIPEIGLRRAMGATAAGIARQIVTEQLLLSSVAMLVGLALLMQLPLTGLLGDALNWQVFSGAAALSMGVIYLLSLLCALYPGWRASRLHPAAALHHE